MGLLLMAGCGGPPKGEAGAQSGPSGANQGPTPVDVAIATLLTLLIIPCFYLLLHDFRGSPGANSSFRNDGPRQSLSNLGPASDRQGKTIVDWIDVVPVPSRPQEI